MYKFRSNIGKLYLLFSFYFIIINTAIIFPFFHDLSSDFNFYNAEYASVDKDGLNEFNCCSGLNVSHCSEKIRKIEDCQLCLILSAQFYEINFKSNLINKLSPDKKILYSENLLHDNTIYLKIPARAPPKNII